MNCLIRLTLKSRSLNLVTSKYAPQPFLPFTQNLATREQEQGKITTPNDDNWRMIYRLPIVRLVAAFNRLKIYQGILTIVGTPAVFALEQSGALSSTSAIVVAAVGTSGLATLFLASFFVRNLVGFIYINERDDKLKLAYVNYWGNRKDATFDVEELMPVWDEVKPSQFYQLVRLRDNKQQEFKLLRRFAVVEEPETFTDLFSE